MTPGEEARAELLHILTAERFRPYVRPPVVPARIATTDARHVQEARHLRAAPTHHKEAS